MRSAGRLIRHEWTLAGVGAILLAAVMTWPTLRHPRTTIPQDTFDPSLQAWQLAWVGHALFHHPAGLWNANVSFPEQYTLAYSDSLLGYAPIGLLGSGPAAALLRYNVLFVLAFAFALFGAYALIRQLGAGRAGALVGGLAFAYAPWRFSHAGHLNILSTGAIPLSLAMLARGHGWALTEGYRAGRVRPGWALAGWLLAGWQITLGFGLGVPFTYVLILIALVAVLGWALRRPELPRRLIGADLVGGVVFSAVVLVTMYPYLRVLQLHPDSRRNRAWLVLFSPPLRGFFTAAQENWIWGSRDAAARAKLGWPAEMTLLPGFTLIALACLGLAISIWTLRTRLLLGLGVLLSGWLAMGTTTVHGGDYGYMLLFRLLPGFDGSRTPGRLVLWTILLLCVLAAGAVQELQHWLTGTTETTDTPWATATTATGLTATGLTATGLTATDATVTDASATSTRATGLTATGLTAGRCWAGVWLLVPLAAVLLEGVTRTPHPVVATAPAVLARAPDPIMVLPTDELYDLHVMLWSTAGFPRIVNGASGYDPPQADVLRQQMTGFPDVATVATLRTEGVRTVIVMKADVRGTPYAASARATGAGLGITRRDLGYAVVFSLEK